jgi:hypothetical protein
MDEKVRAMAATILACGHAVCALRHVSRGRKR